MKIDLKKEEGITLNYRDCPRCHRPFNAKKRKKTEHHVLPKFLKPLTDILMTICLECHNDLNSHYLNPNNLKNVNRTESTTFDEFTQNYGLLVHDFEKKKISRHAFDQASWANLISYLGSIQ